MKTAIRLALGAAVASALVAAPAAAGGGWGYPGYRPPPPRYGGYYGGGNGGAIAAAAIGGLLFGGLLVAASQPKPQTYTVTTVSPGVPVQVLPAPVQVVPPPPPPVYNSAPVAPDATAAQAQVDLCARAAERWAQGTGGIARVVAIQSVTGDQANAQITGTLEIANAAPGQPNATGFTCWASYGTVTGIKLG